MITFNSLILSETVLNLYRAMTWDEFLRHFRFWDEEDSGLSDEEQERKGPKNRPKNTRKRIHQDEKNFLEKFKTVSKVSIYFPLTETLSNEPV